jgi:hypothetical protein
MHLFAIGDLLLLLAVANGAPLIGKKLLGARFAYPLDRGARLGDGQPILGAAKTLRGVVLSLIATTLAAPLIGIDARVGALVSAAAMAGDLLSSFVKRRLRLKSSAMCIGLDQIPESLLPALAASSALGLSLADIALATLLFLVGELALSRVLYVLKIREQPY